MHALFTAFQVLLTWPNHRSLKELPFKIKGSIASHAHNFTITHSFACSDLRISQEIQENKSYRGDITYFM